MVQTFSLLAVDTYLCQKQIVLTFSKGIDKNNMVKVITELYERSSKSPVNFNIDIDDTKFIITYNDWPEPNKDYILSIKNLLSIDGESLISDFKRKVTFNSDIINTVKIINPAMFEKVNALKVNLESTEELKDNEEFYIEIAKDNAFIDTPIKTTFNTSSKEIELDNDGNYFIRARVCNSDEFGLFSETISFYLEKSIEEENGEHNGAIQGNKDDEPILDLEPLTVDVETEEYETPDCIILEFNKEIDEASLSNIKIKRQVVR